MSVGKKLRFEIFKRDKFTCQYCGRKPPEVVLNVDHVLAVSKGGGDDPWNLLTGCWDCNVGKSNRPVDVVDLPLEDSPEFRVEKLEQIKALHTAILKNHLQFEQWANDLVDTWVGLSDYRDDWIKKYETDDLRKSLKVFIQKLSAEEISDAMGITFSKADIPRHNRVRYFCGVCWRKIKGDF